MKLPQLSLNQRVLISASFLLIVFIGLVTLALDRAFYDSAKSARQERLLSQVYLLIAASEVNREGDLTIPNTLAESRFSLPNSGLYAQITNQDGKIVWQSTSSLGQAVQFGSPLTAGEKQFSIFPQYFTQSLGINWVVGSNQFGFTVSVSEDLREFNQQISLYRKNLWSWLIGLSILLLLAQLAVLRWGLRPLNKVTTELNAIESGKQAEIKGIYPSEISRLSNSLNSLIQHERAQQTRYRNGLGDLAHSLKTPLAVMRGSLTKLDSALIEQVDVMDKIIAYQLQRAATAARQHNLMQRTPVLNTVQRISASLNKIHQDKNIQLTINIATDDAINIDEGDLFELLGNLLENAFKWANTQIHINSITSEAHFTLSIEDDGPGVPETQIAHILQRGVRADEQTPGHGIGLSIVRDIIEAYQGELKIERSPLGGAKFSIILPKG